MHDALFKATFGQPDLARSELELVLPAQLRAQLDLTTLAASPGSFVDEELRSAHSDLLYAVRTTSGGEALVYVLFEHQSSFDARMPLRLLRYVMLIWNQWLRDHPDTNKLPIVLPVLLHHGDEGWKAPPKLESMFDAPPSLLEAARPFLPLFDFVLDDLAALSLETLASRALAAHARLAQLALSSSRSLGRLRHAAPLMAAIAQPLAKGEQSREWLQQLYVYLLQATTDEVEKDEVRTILLEIAGPEGREDVMTAGQRLIEQGRVEGRAEGAEALRTAITSVLSARGVAMTDPARAQLVSCADLPTLKGWVVRAATASSADEVFAA